MAQASSRSTQGGESQQKQRKSAAANLTMTTLRGLGQFYDMQAATTRIMLRAQMRAASALGLPDYSRIFEVSDDRATRLFSAATENLAQFVEQEDGSLAEVPSQVIRLFEQQAIDANERWKHGLEELHQQAAESIEELKELSRQQAEEIARATESLSEATEESLREGSEQFRATVRQGREAGIRQAQAIREGAERAASEGEEAVEEGAEGMKESAEEMKEGAPGSRAQAGRSATAEAVERGGSRPRPGARH